MTGRQDTIFALATPPGRSAIAVIRITAMADRPGGVARAKMVSCLPVMDSCLPFHRQPVGVPFLV